MRFSNIIKSKVNCLIIYRIYDDLYRVLKIKEEELNPDEKNKRITNEKGYDFLNDRLLLDTTEMFYILMKLNL